MLKVHYICAMTRVGIKKIYIKLSVAVQTGTPSPEDMGRPQPGQKDKLGCTVRLFFFFKVEILNFLRPGKDNLNSF